MRRKVKMGKCPPVWDFYKLPKDLRDAIDRVIRRKGLMRPLVAGVLTAPPPPAGFVGKGIGHLLASEKPKASKKRKGLK